MSLFPVSSKKFEELEEKMAALGIRPEDLSEEFVKGSGAGGQKINKTSSTVLLTHLPSKIQIRCQKGRSQAMNRYWARKFLIEKLEEKLLGEQSAKQQEIEKIRRQKRKRSRRAKEKVLAQKSEQSLLKKSRKKVRADLGE